MGMKRNLGVIYVIQLNHTATSIDRVIEKEGSLKENGNARHIFRIRKRVDIS